MGKVVDGLFEGGLDVADEEEGVLCEEGSGLVGVVLRLGVGSCSQRTDWHFGGILLNGFVAVCRIVVRFLRKQLRFIYWRYIEMELKEHFIAIAIAI